MNDKQELRKEVRRKKQSCPKEQLEKWSQAVCHLLEQTEEFQNAETVLLYYALPDEVDTTPLIRKYAGCKQILLPVVCGDDLVVRRYQNEQTLSVENPLGIPEPEGEDINLSKTNIDLVVVPGMAFTANGCRLGRGKGYYDRLLPRIPAAYKLGLCFPFQLLDQIPAEAHDIPMDEVLAAAQTTDNE